MAAAAGLALLRDARPALSSAATGAMLGLCAAAGAGLWALGKRHDWLPSRSAVEGLLGRAKGIFGAGRLRHV